MLNFSIRHFRLLSLIFALPANAFAIYDCDFIASEKCKDCSAPMSFNCNNGTAAGNVKNDLDAKAISVVVFNPITGSTYGYWLKNPSEPIGSYAGELNNNTWIKEALLNQGVRVNNDYKVNLIGAKFQEKGRGILYSDSNASSPASKLPSKNFSNLDRVDARCGFVQQPMLTVSPGCQSKSAQICFGLATCRDSRGTIGNYIPVACKANSPGICPSATECAKDKSVEVTRGVSVDPNLKDIDSTDGVKILPAR